MDLSNRDDSDPERYSAAYPAGAERWHEAIWETDIGDEAESATDWILHDGGCPHSIRRGYTYCNMCRDAQEMMVGDGWSWKVCWRVEGGRQEGVLVKMVEHTSLIFTMGSPLILNENTILI